MSRYVPTVKQKVCKICLTPFETTNGKRVLCEEWTCLEENLRLLRRMNARKYRDQKNPTRTRHVSKYMKLEIP